MAAGDGATGPQPFDGPRETDGAAFRTSTGAEVDDMVAGLSSLMEPIIIVFLGGLIGGIVVSMYLPIFKLGAVV